MTGVLLEARPYRPFKSSEEYLYAMKEDLAEWLNMLYSELELNVDNFMDRLETGIVLCKHANSVRKSAEEYVARKQLRKMNSSLSMTVSLMTKRALPITQMSEIHYKLSAKPGTFFARDNVSNFIDFCRHGLEIIECLLFETDDLILRKNEKNVILCLLEVARRGAKFGMLAPMLVQMEREIDREIAAEQRLARGDVVTEENSSEDEDMEEEACVQYGPIPQIITNDLKSLDEMVRDLVEKCTCPTQFPMIRVSEGKYRIGDTKVLIFVRILRSHVMVRVGGGWDTLSHYLDKHDPCRCRTGHRAALSSKLILKNVGSLELNNAQVHYERSPPRTRRSSASSSSSGHGRDTRDLLTTSPSHANRSRSPTPKRDGHKSNLQPPKFVSTFLFDNSSRHRSVSPKRGRNRSPGAPHRPSYDSPTAASRNRSRSPSVRVPETHKRNYSGTYNDIKSSDVKLQTTTDLADLELENTQRAKVTLEANEASNNNEENKQNDSGSEVSDEGYRSLGVIVTTPLVGEGKVVTNGQKAQKHRLSANSSITDSEPIESPTSECSSGPNEEDNQVTNGDDDKSTIKDNSVSGSCNELRENNERHVRSREPSVDSSTSSPNRRITRSPMKKSSWSSSRGSSPVRRNSDDKRTRDSSSRRPSHMDDTDSSRRRSSKDDETRKMTRSRSASSGEVAFAETSPIKKNVRNVTTAADKSGTWNGKTKKRSSLNSDTFTPSSPQFARGGVGRSSLGAGKTTYDPTTGRRVQKQSPTKNMSPLLADLLRAKNLEDDKTILLKMKEIIDQYSGIFENPAEKKFDSGFDDSLDFTTEWVRNNGSIKRIESGDSDEKSSPNKRKDSKYDGANSKIPAPVFYKQHVSEKEC